MNAALAFEAEIAEVKSVHPFHERREVLWFVGDEAGFEVSAEGAFGADACASEVGGADEGFEAVDDDRFGVDPGAERPFEEITFNKSGVAVKVFPKTRAGFLGVKEADGDALVDEI